MAHDATADKTSSPKHGYAVHSLIDPRILGDALDRAVERRADCLGGLCRRTAFVDMMPDNIDQNLCRGADSLQLFHCFIDQRLSFCVKLLCLFDHRLCSIEKIDQRLARRQRFLNLSKLCIAETRNVTNEVKEPVLQHNPPCYWLYRWPINPCNRTDSPASQVSFYTKWPAKAAVGHKADGPFHNLRSAHTVSVVDVHPNAGSAFDPSRRHLAGVSGTNGSRLVNWKKSLL